MILRGLAIVVGLCLPSLAAGHKDASRSTSYERWIAPTLLDHQEQQLVHTARAWAHGHGHGLDYDWRLGRACAELLPWARAHAGEPMPLSSLRRAAWANGWTDGELAAVAIVAPKHLINHAIRQQLDQAMGEVEATHVGVAVDTDDIAADEGGRTTAIVALSRRLVRLSPTPDQRATHHPLRLTGQVVAQKTTALTAAVTRADGTVVSQQHIPLHQKKFFAPLAVGEHEGMATVQLMVERGRGPEVAITFPICVGSKCHALPTHISANELTAKPSGTGAPDTSLLSLIWGLRQTHDLNLPPPSQNLMRAARAHAQDMADNHFFAHISTKTGDVTQRLALLNQPYIHVIENLGEADCVDDIFTEWLDSPSHLANLLDPKLDALGLGLWPQQSDSGKGLVAVLVMAKLP